MTNKELAIQLVRKHPDAPTKTLARRLYEENKESFSSLETARSCIRTVRGNNGVRDSNEAVADLKRGPGKSGWTPECPPSLAEPWVPFVVEQPERTLILSDIHMPFHDKAAVEAAVEYGKKRKPTTVLLNGDVIDFFTISRYEKNPKHRDLKNEIELTKQFLAWIRSQFKKADLIFKIGNHDQRWDKFIWNKAVELWNLDALQLHNILDFEKYGITRVDDNPVMLGELPVLHGHEFGRGLTAPVNPARGAFLRVHHTVLIGHLHQTSSHAESNLWNKETMVWSTGCLCDRRPEYARINRWNWGFAFDEVNSSDDYNLSNLRIGEDYRVRSS